MPAGCDDVIVPLDRFETNPIDLSLPTVKAGQTGTRDDKRAFTDDGYAA